MKKIIKILSTAALLFGVSACELPFGLGHIDFPWENNSESNPESDSVSESIDLSTFDIRFISKLPIVAPYKDYDVMDAIIPFEDTVYSFTGTYLDGRGRTKNITFDGSVMNVPQDGTVAEINVSAVHEGQNLEKQLLLSVIGTGDQVDGACVDLWREDNISSTLSYNPNYIKVGDSSIKVSFSGYYNRWGTQYMCTTGRFSNNDEKGIFDQEFLTIYQSDDVKEAYKDAVLFFWVYNDMKEQNPGVDDNLYFGIRIHECSYSGNVDVDWGQSPVITAKRGEWTLVYWYLKDLGKTTEFYKDIEKFYDPNISAEDYRDCYDSVALKVVGKNVALNGSGDFDTDVKYTYTFYFDNYDVMTRSDFEKTYAEYLKKN